MSQSVSIGHYRAALTAPGALAPAIASALARLPIAMVGLALLFYVQRATGSFAIAGAVTAGALVGVATGSVAQGRIVDRIGPTRPLLAFSAVFTVLVALEIAAVQSGAHPVLLVVAAYGVGSCQPMVSSASRALWAQLLPPGRVRNAAYAYDAISLEVFFILGPGLAGLLAATSWWAGTGVVVSAAMLLAGAVAFALTPAVRAWRGSRPGERSLGLLGAIRMPGMQTLVIAALGFGVTIGFVEVAVPAAATAAGRPEFGGLLLSLASVSSVVAGLLYGVRPWPRGLHRRPAALLLAFSLLLPLLALSSGLGGLAAAILVVGCLITPQATTHSTVIDSVAPPGASAEAFGWLITAVTLGLAVGQSTSGVIVEFVGPPTAFLAACAAGVLLAGLVWLRRRTLLPAPPASDADALHHEPVCAAAG